MFERPRHRQVLALLSRIDASLFETCRAWFAGGTRIVLDLDEYRESAYVDFLCANHRGYAELRSSARRKGPGTLFVDTDRLHFPREAIRRDLRKALEAFESNADYSRRCFEGLSISDPSPIREGLDLLRREL